MPIRMIKDNPDEDNNRRRSSSRRNVSSNAGSGIGGGMGNLIGGLLPMLLRRPKLLIILVIVGIIFYFVGGKGCTEQLAESGVSSLFSRGSVLDQGVYEQTEIYEPLADNIKNPLPEIVSLLEYAPSRKNQGQQGSCVAWASAYAARTILEAKRTGKNPNEVAFSPSFMYNQISIDHNTCQGSYIKLAMDNMYNTGAVPFNSFAYDPTSCTKKPSQSLMNSATEFKIEGFQRLTDDRHSKVEEMLAMKQNLAKGSPVVIGMMVGGSFMENMMGKDVWIPTNSDYSQYGFGGHAMCVIGYDDYKEGGAFQIMNSWGPEWGNNGVAWVRYTDFKEFNAESYGLYPMGDASKKAVAKFSGEFGLAIVNPNNLSQVESYIKLNKVSSNYFETAHKISATDKFKVEFTNNVECYTYIFGEELDGTSYVLFPYTAKHSPFCGITGTRLFPRDYSMQSDGKSKLDRIGVVVSKKPLNYDELNSRISNSTSSSFEGKMKDALGASGYYNDYRNSGNTIAFETEVGDDQPKYFVIGVKLN